MHYANLKNEPGLANYYDCSKNWEDKCPLCTIYWKLKNSKNQADVEKSGLINRTTKYYSYVQIIEDELNTMRSGRSVDNTIVSAELEKYYNSLSLDERMGMYTYMTALAKILTGEVAAEDAPDPSDQEQEQKPEKKLSDIVKKEPEQIEDTAPPVKVSGTNESVNESLIKFIKTLLKEEL